MSDAVDIFDGRTETWSTAKLTVPVEYLAATSLPDLGVAIFAGGYCTLSLICFLCCSVRFIIIRMLEWQECGALIAWT
jgi:hypothetical protein